MLFVKNSYKKFLSPFFLFCYPNHEWTHLCPNMYFWSFSCKVLDFNYIEIVIWDDYIGFVYYVYLQLIWNSMCM
jgi:hypothetical protein